MNVEIIISIFFFVVLFIVEMVKKTASNVCILVSCSIVLHFIFSIVAVAMFDVYHMHRENKFVFFLDVNALY